MEKVVVIWEKKILEGIYKIKWVFWVIYVCILFEILFILKKVVWVGSFRRSSEYFNLCFYVVLVLSFWIIYKRLRVYFWFVRFLKRRKFIVIYNLFFFRKKIFWSVLLGLGYVMVYYKRERCLWMVNYFILFIKKNCKDCWL